MKLEKTIFGQAIQFFATGEASGRRSPIPLIRAMQDRYGFVEVPHKVSELKFETGVNFLQGYYKDTVIDKFQVYNNGILCEAATDNQICSEFIEDVLSWAPEYFNPITIEPTAKAFQSKLEISSEKDVRNTFAKFAGVGELIAQLLKGYGLTAPPPYVAAGVVLQHEPQREMAGVPNFEFAWRADRTFADRVYYSSAPLRTQDHLQVLDLLEQLL